ncbi:MAG: hypothetical protein DMF93_01395 [Acidobacteria bacterium]|nr:MAG: hypothetical protein DMF93_01395 [Acidobacteriota bacterium]
MESGRSCCCVIRRMPETTRNSGVALVASVAQAPPLCRTASSRIVGVPRSMPNRTRSSDPPAPSHVTASASPASAAVRPGAGLYAVMLQVSGSAAADRLVSTNAIHAMCLFMMPSVSRRRHF